MRMRDLACSTAVRTCISTKARRGIIRPWGSRCFDYGKDEVVRFLLSNCKYWLEEYHLDGFRFDGVTSMIYWDHGLGKDFNGYEPYFDAGVDENAVTYLGLANLLIRQIKPEAVTIAEDVSGMAGLAAPFEAGGEWVSGSGWRWVWPTTGSNG